MKTAPGLRFSGMLHAHRLVVSYWCCETLSVPSSRVKTAWPLKLGRTRCPRKSVHNLQSILCKIPEEQGSHMHCVRSLKPRKTASAYSNCWWRSLSSCSLVLQCDHQLFSYVRPTFSWIFAAQFGRIIWCQHEILISDDYKYNIEVIPLKCSQIWGTELLCLKVRRPLWLLLLVRRQTKSL